MAKRMRGLFKRGNVWWCCYKSLSGRIIRESTKKKGYDEAVTFLETRHNELKAGKEPERKKPAHYTFLELAEEYLKWAERQRSFTSKKFLIEQLKHDFGTMPLRSFTTRIIEQYQTERGVKGKRTIKINGKAVPVGNKPATVNRLIATLKHMFTKAGEWEMVEEETLKKVRRVKLLEEKNKRLRFLSEEEIKTLIDYCDAHLKPIVVTALHTGMRKREILLLKWDNVDLKHGFILLDHTKNGERREVPVNRTLRATLEGLPRRLDGGHVFFDPKTNTPYGDVKKSFATALKKAGIRDFTFHDLRHTFASHLVMAGTDLVSVKELLGHSDIKMTLRYAHLAPAHKVKALDVLDRTLNPEKFSTSQLVHNLAGRG